MDKKALRILNKTFWKNGWREDVPMDEKIEREYLTREEFLFAKEKGVMFDTITMTHDECIEIIFDFLDVVSLDEMIRAFLCSLSKRKLYLRSILMSYFAVKDMQKHTYKNRRYSSGVFWGKRTYRNMCALCVEDHTYHGILEAYKTYENEDVNVLNFERIKWGGIRRNELFYIAFDIREYMKIREEVTEPEDEDIALFKQILQAIDECDKTETPRKLEKRIRSFDEWKKLSNSAEIDVILEILEAIGVLKPAEVRNVKKNDYGFLENWIGEDGYQKDVVNELFGQYLP